MTMKRRNGMATLAERNSPRTVFGIYQSDYHGWYYSDRIKLTMERTIIDSRGNGVESDSLRRRALGIGGLSVGVDERTLSERVLLLQREIKLCLR